jgi:Tol biopolymer transport system component
VRRSRTQPRFSPDGRWLVYESNESGAFEIYVRPFPRPRRQLANFQGRRHQRRLVARAA